VIIDEHVELIGELTSANGFDQAAEIERATGELGNPLETLQTEAAILASAAFDAKNANGIARDVPDLISNWRWAACDAIADFNLRPAHLNSQLSRRGPVKVGG
jgi:hypothetical protein